MGIAAGTRVRVDFTATINEDPDTTVLPAGMTEVQEADGGEWTHFLNLDSDAVSVNADGTVTARFTGTTAGIEGDGTYGTTVVQESGNSHSLFITSSAITFPLERKAAMTVIDGTEDYLSAGQIRERIAQLAEGLDAWAVRRVRNNAVLARRPTQALAVQYIDEEDFDRERVVAVYDRDGAPQPPELTALEKLQSDADGTIPRWDEDDTALVRWSVITDIYAQNLFISSVAGSPVDRDSLADWPYCYIDWASAAESIEERRNYVIYGETRYYQAVD